MPMTTGRSPSTTKGKAAKTDRPAARAGPFNAQAQRMLSSPNNKKALTPPNVSEAHEEVSQKLQRMRARGAGSSASSQAGTPRRKTMQMSAQDDAFLARAEATLGTPSQEGPQAKRSQKKELGASWTQQAEDMLARGGN